MTTSRQSCSVGLFASLLVALAGRPADASPDFPAVLQRKLALTSTPPCTLCHADTNGGVGTIVTPFGLTLQGYGARGSDTAALERALERDIAAGSDSDADDIADSAELTGGGDPNDGPGSEQLIPRREHGCNVPATIRGRLRAGWAAAAWFVMSFGRRRRRTR